MKHKTYAVTFAQFFGPEDDFQDTDPRPAATKAASVEAGVAFCRAKGLDYRVANGFALVEDWINLSGQNLEHLPDLSRLRCGGSFTCRDNRLTSLAGSPANVAGSFSCTANLLTTLEGVPPYVGGDVECFHNPLISIYGLGSFTSFYFTHGGHHQGCRIADIGLAMRHFEVPPRRPALSCCADPRLTPGK